jgi:endogenous inhibitor of DNA gyrase (YacG/DUF329 family)
MEEIKCPKCNATVLFSNTTSAKLDNNDKIILIDAVTECPNCKTLVTISHNIHTI